MVTKVKRNMNKVLIGLIVLILLVPFFAFAITESDAVQNKIAKFTKVPSFSEVRNEF